MGSKSGLCHVFCCCWALSWWRYQMKAFSALLALCEGNPPVTGRFPSQRPVTRSFDMSFDLHLNKRLSKDSRCRWFETPSRSIWRHCNNVISCRIGPCYNETRWYNQHAANFLWNVSIVVVCFVLNIPVPLKSLLVLNLNSLSYICLDK